MNNMGKVEKIVQSAPNGIITAAQLTKAGLHRGYLHDFVESGELYRFGRGLYVQSSAWEDDFYLLQRKYSRGIYSHDTALYLLGFSQGLQRTVFEAGRFDRQACHSRKL